MFISLKKILPSTLKTNKIHDQINNISSCIKIEEIIKNFLNKKNTLNIKVDKYKNKILFLRTNNFSISSELKLKEEKLKKEISKQGVLVDQIKFIS